MSKIISYIKDSITELTTKVTWPKYSELQSSTVLVLVASVIFALVIFGIDKVYEFGFSWYYNNF